MMLHQSSPILPAAPSVRSRKEPGFLGTLRRFLVIAAVAFWLGGFTFYAGVAIPMGVQVLGTHRAVGFITERVTNWLNVGGVAGLTILLWNLAAVWRGSGRLIRRTLLVTWLLMACIQIELICLHPFMDRLLSIHPVRTILDVDRFDRLHRIYLMSTTVQWCLGVLHVWCISAAWGDPARGTAAFSPDKIT